MGYTYLEGSMLENLVSYYRKSDGNTKKKILSCIFSKKIILEKSKVATYEFTTPIQVLLNASKVCRGTKKRQEVETDLLSCMAPLMDGSCNFITLIMI